MKIVVASKNPVKLKATQNILEKIYPAVEVEDREVDSGVPDQPIGLEVTVQGAINRAKNAFSPDFDLSVGIEWRLLVVWLLLVAVGAFGRAMDLVKAASEE